MKKPSISILLSATLILLIFTVGFFVGRNTGSDEWTLSFPEEMKQIPATVSTQQNTASDKTASITDLIDINSASYEELMTLPGIGDGLALEIISYRAEKGGFSYVEELMEIPGIGENRLESILDLIIVGGNP